MAAVSSVLRADTFVFFCTGPELVFRVSLSVSSGAASTGRKPACIGQNESEAGPFYAADSSFYIWHVCFLHAKRRLYQQSGFCCADDTAFVVFGARAHGGKICREQSKTADRLSLYDYDPVLYA